MPSQCWWCNRNEPSLITTWIRRPAAARRRPETGLHFRHELHRSEVAARGSSPSAPLGTEPFSDLVHVKLCLHRLLSKITNCKILVADDKADFPLSSLASHLPAEAPKLGKVALILNLCRRR